MAGLRMTSLAAVVARAAAAGSAALLLAVLAGCQTMGYYAQAVGGQMEIWRAARPIDRVIGDDATDADLRGRLERAVEIREFASRELALPDNRSYRRYADLGRPYVVWNVFAAKEFSLQPETWCFPFAGCVAYRGYFAEDSANRFAGRLERRGLDVLVAGIPAYSTLGWFSDPVLSTFVHYPETELARLIFHELAHQVVYVRDDTAFNESFAMAVELEGVRRWLDADGSAAQRAQFEVSQSRRREFLDLFARYRQELRRLYAEPLDEETMRNSKHETFARMRDEYSRMKEAWNGFSGYDRWFEEPLNNAKLIAVAAYAEWVPAFRTLLARHDGDLPGFYAEVRELSRLPREARRAKLEKLSAAGA